MVNDRVRLALIVAVITSFPRHGSEEPQLHNQMEPDAADTNKSVESSKSGEPDQTTEPMTLQRELAPNPRDFDPLQQLTAEQIESSKRSSVNQMLDWMRIDGTVGSMGDSLQKPILDVEKKYSQGDVFMVAMGGNSF